MSVKDSQAQKLTFTESYLKKETLGVFLFGISSGFPLTLVLSITSTWLATAGVSKSDIGLFSLVTLVYAWKFLWSPAIDQLPLGFLTRLLGRRRSWMLVISILMAAVILLVARFDPAKDLYAIALCILGIAFLSASLDIVIDAYRIEILPQKLIGHGATMSTLGYRAGNFIAGYGVFILADATSWGVAIPFLTLLLLPGLLAAFWVGAPKSDTLVQDHKSVPERLNEAIIQPFADFAKRQHWWLILLFIFVFKLGDAVTAVMTQAVIVDMGYTLTEQANANKLVGLIALISGIMLGSLLYFKMGTYRSLFVTGILMMLTNLGFALLAISPPNVYLLGAVVGAENFATGLGTTVLVSYLSGLCNVMYSATQYALLNSLANQARAVFGSSSGFIVESIGWVPFFFLTTLMAVPGLILLVIIMRLGVDVALNRDPEKGD